MSEKENIARVCEVTLRNIAVHYKYQLRYHIQSKGEVIDNFRRETYVIFLIVEKLLDVDAQRMYRKLYNELKNELLDYMPYLEM